MTATYVLCEELIGTVTQGIASLNRGQIALLVRSSAPICLQSPLRLSKSGCLQQQRPDAVRTNVSYLTRLASSVRRFAQLYQKLLISLRKESSGCRYLSRCRRFSRNFSKSQFHLQSFYSGRKTPVPRLYNSFESRTSSSRTRPSCAVTSVAKLLNALFCKLCSS